MYISSITGMKYFIAKLPEFFRPVQTPLQRLGNPGDGGYVVPRKAIHQSTHLLTFGLDTNWSFEADYARQKRSADGFTGIDGYDPALTKWLLTKRTVRHIGRRILGKRISDMGTFRSYRRMFGTDNIRHHRQWIGRAGLPNTVDFQQCMAALPDQARVFLKMDIEGSEYEVLDQIAASHVRLTGMAVKFHSFDDALIRCGTQLTALQCHFHIAHIHVNNYGSPGRDGCPTVVEVSYINKSLALRTQLGRHNLPLADLDCPNNPSRPDFRIQFASSQRQRAA
jgi:hypothetical protein